METEERDHVEDLSRVLSLSREEVEEILALPPYPADNIVEALIRLATPFKEGERVSSGYGDTLDPDPPLYLQYTKESGLTLLLHHSRGHGGYMVCEFNNPHEASDSEWIYTDWKDAWRVFLVAAFFGTYPPPYSSLTPQIRLHAIDTVAASIHAARVPDGEGDVFQRAQHAVRNLLTLTSDSSIKEAFQPLIPHVEMTAKGAPDEFELVIIKREESCPRARYSLTKHPSSTHSRRWGLSEVKGAATKSFDFYYYEEALLAFLYSTMGPIWFE